MGEIITEVVNQAAEITGVILDYMANQDMLDLADDYYDLYRDQREFYYETFQTGVEAPLANELYSVPYYNMDYLARINTLYDPATGPLGGASTDALGWLTRHSAAYGTTPSQALLHNLQVDSAAVKTDWANYMARFEEQYFDVTNDRRLKHRIMLHNVGIKQGSAVAASMSGAVAQYSEAIGGLADSLATIGNGAMKYVGYKRGLSDTADDFDRMEYQAPAMSIPDYNRTAIGQLA